MATKKKTAATVEARHHSLHPTYELPSDMSDKDRKAFLKVVPRYRCDCAECEARNRPIPPLPPKMGADWNAVVAFQESIGAEPGKLARDIHASKVANALSALVAQKMEGCGLSRNSTEFYGREMRLKGEFLAQVEASIPY